MAAHVHQESIFDGKYWDKQTVFLLFSFHFLHDRYKKCDETLYKFSFGVITSSYILLVLMLCCSCVCGLCLVHRRGLREEEGEGEADEEEEEETGEDEENGEREQEEEQGRRGTREGGDEVAQRSADGESSCSDISDGQSVPQTSSGYISPSGGHEVRDHEERELVTLNHETQDQLLPNLHDLEPLQVGEYSYSPIMSPRQLTADEQGSLPSLHSTSV